MNPTILQFSQELSRETDKNQRHDMSLFLNNLQCSRVITLLL